jgi:hypothetical protein
MEVTRVANELEERRAAKAAEKDGEQAPDEPTNVVIPGAEEQLTLGVGGDRPDESTIVFRGGEFQARGQWKKGMRVRFMVEGTIDAVELSDKRDRKLNVVTGTKRKHGMTVEHVEALPAAQD